MGEDNKSEIKLKNKKYLLKIQQPKYEMEIISRIVIEHEGEMDELLQTEEALDTRTIEAWKKGEKVPKKSNLKKIRKTEEYSNTLEEFVKEKEECYEKRRCYYRKIEQDELIDRLIPKENLERELFISNLVMDVEGNIYERVVRPASVASDEIEFEMIYEEINKSIEIGRKELIRRVENLSLNDLSDLQKIASLKAFLEFYEKQPNASFLFEQFFSKQFSLFSQLLDKEIGFNEFSAELGKLIEIVCVKAEFENEE